MFGIGDFFTILLGGGVFAAKSMKDSSAKTNQQAKEELEQKFIASYTDPELEEKIKQDILNPSKYDEIWERIEKYKEDGGPVSIWYMQMYSPYSEWDTVGKSREPFRDKRGNLTARTKSETEALEGNRSAACSLLMHTYGKMTERNARLVAMRSSARELSYWLANGWPQYIKLGESSCEDLKNNLDNAPHRYASTWRVVVLTLVFALLLWIMPNLIKEISNPIVGLIVGIGLLGFMVYMYVIWLHK